MGRRGALRAENRYNRKYYRRKSICRHGGYIGNFLSRFFPRESNYYYIKSLDKVNDFWGESRGGTKKWPNKAIFWYTIKFNPLFNFFFWFVTKGKGHPLVFGLK